MSAIIKESGFSISNWVNALTLSERASLLRHNQDGLTLSQKDAAHARKRMDQWRSQPPFTDRQNFIRRLEADGLTEDKLLYLLSESAQSLSHVGVSAPQWLVDIEEAFSNSAERYDFAFGIGEYEEHYPLPDGFINAFIPLLQLGVRRFQDGISKIKHRHEYLPFDPNKVVALFLSDIVRRVEVQCRRTMILELNVARLQDELNGETPQERFRSFIERLRCRDVVLPLLEEYPVLARQVSQTINFWVNNSLEFLKRLSADWERIKSTFVTENDKGILSEVLVGAGDSHREGRSVIIATFTSGFKLVYKPRSLSVDIHFGDLLRWLNERGTHPPFQTQRVLSRREYGWIEFVNAAECTTTLEVKRFYERLGSYLALLYMLEATDFHYENLIAAGEHPTLVDLESLFHPRPAIHMAEAAKLPLASDVMDHSVLRVGLLPARAWLEYNSRGLDVSGMGGAEGQETPFAILQVENYATDEMRMIRAPGNILGGKNRPVLNGNNVALEDYADEILKGFTTIYQLLLNHREELLADGGPIATFAEDEVRVVLRPTIFYSNLLTESYHPDVLGDALERNCLFDRLWSSTEHSSTPRRHFSSEITDLQNGDVPIFFTRPASRDIWTSRHEHITEFLKEPSLSGVKRRIQTLSEEDLFRQLWFIRASLTSLTKGLGHSSSVGSRLEKPRSLVNRQRLLSAAESVADRLEALAIRPDNRVSWIGLTFVGETSWALLPLTDDLYNGLSGISLFLAYLGDVTGNDRYTSLAKSAVRSVTDKLRAEHEARIVSPSIGGYQGRGGILYALSHIGALWNDPQLYADAELLLEGLPELIDLDESFDIISGAAGCIGGLLSLYHANSSKGAIECAVKCAERLLEKAQPQAKGIAWHHSSIRASKPLTGYSHGAAGIGAALLEVANVTGDKRFEKLALEAFEYERSVFVAKDNNWPDFRLDLPGQPPANQELSEEELHCMLTWCHGAPGIGLSRLRAITMFDVPELQTDLSIAQRTTLEKGFGQSHCLCHGDLGNLDFLLEAGRTLNDLALLAGVKLKCASILESVDRYGWLCGTPNSVETPGLMTGLAGIGYEFLRIAEPDKIPCVLRLEVPIRA